MGSMQHQAIIVPAVDAGKHRHRRGLQPLTLPLLSCISPPPSLRPRYLLYLWRLSPPTRVLSVFRRPTRTPGACLIHRYGFCAAQATRHAGALSVGLLSPRGIACFDVRRCRLSHCTSERHRVQAKLKPLEGSLRCDGSINNHFLTFSTEARACYHMVADLTLPANRGCPLVFLYTYPTPLLADCCSYDPYGGLAHALLILAVVIYSDLTSTQSRQKAVTFESSKPVYTLELASLARDGGAPIWLRHMVAPHEKLLHLPNSPQPHPLRHSTATTKHFPRSIAPHLNPSTCPYP